MPAYIAYYRVSTDRQGASGLGLEAQRHTVASFIGLGKLIAEYTEIESGKRHDNRPQLLAAIEQCRKSKAVLVIAKLDRLARDVHFISGLQKGKVDFVCCDNPHANKTMLQMMAVFAEHEREMISQRTKEALAAAKRRGVKLGNPRLAEATKRAAEVNRSEPPAPEIFAFMRQLQERGESLRAIARQLNRLNLRTARGSQWHAKTVRAVLQQKRSADHAA